MSGGRHPGVYVFFAILLVSAAVLGGTSAGRRFAWSFFTPFVNVCRFGGDVISGLLPEFLQRGVHSRSQRMALEERVRELEARLAQSSELEQENQELRNLLQLPVRSGWRGIGAEIVSRDPARWNQGFVINKGLTDGIRMGAAVLSGSHVIGRITECNRHNARVATVLSAECRMGLQIQGTEIFGISAGNDGDGEAATEFLVDYLPWNLQSLPGTPMVTSGLGGWMPAGLPAGELVAGDDGNLVEVVANSRGRIRCRMPVSLARIHFVVVLTAVSN